MEEDCGVLGWHEPVKLGDMKVLHDLCVWEPHKLILLFVFTEVSRHHSDHTHFHFRQEPIVDVIRSSMVLFITNNLHVEIFQYFHYGRWVVRPSPRLPLPQRKGNTLTLTTPGSTSDKNRSYTQSSDVLSYLSQETCMSCSGPCIIATTDDRW